MKIKKWKFKIASCKSWNRVLKSWHRVSKVDMCVGWVDMCVGWVDMCVVCSMCVSCSTVTLDPLAADDNDSNTLTGSDTLVTTVTCES